MRCPTLVHDEYMLNELFSDSGSAWLAPEHGHPDTPGSVPPRRQYCIIPVGSAQCIRTLDASSLEHVLSVPGPRPLQCREGWPPHA